VHLGSWNEHWALRHHLPYAVHTGYELQPLLEGRKQFADMSDAYPPHRHFNEDKFDRYATEGILYKRGRPRTVQGTPGAVSHQGRSGLRGHAQSLLRPQGEEWRVPAYKLISDVASRSRWNEDFERLQGMLFGYEAWQNDWWIADIRRRRYRFGCFSIYRAVSSDERAWIDAAGYRALPPTQDSALAVSSLWDPPDDDAAQRMMESAGADAPVHLNVRALDPVKGQSAPDHTIPAAHVRDLNRNIEGRIEIVARRQGEVAPEPAGSHSQGNATAPVATRSRHCHMFLHRTSNEP
jgi:hypothetical protein